MTSAHRPPPEIDWDTIQRVADKGERARLESLSDADLDRELREAGIDPEEADGRLLAALAEGGERPARDDPARARTGAGGPAPAAGLSDRPASSVRRVYPPWGARVLKAAPWLAAAAAILVVVFVFPRLRGGEGARPAPTRAGMIRDAALKACQEARWADCEAQLDEAKALDPAGEGDPRVRGARAQIAASHGAKPERSAEPRK